MGTPSAVAVAVAVALALPSAALRAPHRSLRSAAALRASSSPSSQQSVVVIGSGIGGLSAGALLATYGYGVTVCESHDVIGGCAHGFSRKTREGAFRFDSGPSLFSGCSSSPSANPLRQVLDAVGETPEWKTYRDWTMKVPEGDFNVRSGDASAFGAELARLGGPAAARDWRRLRDANAALAALIGALPPIALRADAGAARTALPYLRKNLDPYLFARFGAEFAIKGVDPSGPFSRVLEAAGIEPSSLVWRWFDFLAFALSGLPVTETSAAAVSFMIREFFADGAVLDVPVGGSQAVADALARAVTKNGGAVRTRAHVDEIVVRSGRAVGVRLASGEVLDADYVVSNADVWHTARLLPAAALSGRDLRRSCLDASAPKTPSFLHLHVAFESAGVDLRPHYVTVADWAEPVDARDNCVFIATSALDDGAAPPNHRVLHAYLPATEPFAAWEGLDRRAYADLKAERGEVLWRAVERFVPDIRSRAVLASVGSPSTHARYLRREGGTFGAAHKAGQRTFPGAASPVDGLYCCGDSTFPGIGVPAVAGSGMAVAHAIAPVDAHLALLARMTEEGSLA